MDLRRTDIKQQNKNVEKCTIEEQEVKRMCLNGKGLGAHEVKSQRIAMFIDHFLSY